MKLRYWILPMVLFVPAAHISFAQSDDWNVLKQLPQGQKIKVVTADRKSHQGALESVTDDSIQMRNNRTFSKRDVRRVLMGSGGHRGRNVVIGAAVGAGVGLGIGAAVDNGYTRNGGKEIGTPAFAVVGLLIGMALPSHGKWREVYRVK